MQNFLPAFLNDWHWWEGVSKSGAINRCGRTSAHFSLVHALARLSLCTSSFARLFVLPICTNDITAPEKFQLSMQDLWVYYDTMVCFAMGGRWEWFVVWNNWFFTADIKPRYKVLSLLQTSNPGNRSDMGVWGARVRVGWGLAHCCTIFLCYLGCEIQMINTEIQI